MEKLYFYGWIFLLTAMAGDLIVSFILSLFYKEYSSLKMSISALGNPSSPVRMPFNLWMLLEGILFLLALPAINMAFHDTSEVITNVILVFIAFFAVGACIFTCFFSVSESKAQVTFASKVHGAGSAIGFMLLLFVPLLVSVLYFKAQDNAMGAFSAVCFIIALAFFVLFIMSDKKKFEDTVVNNEGLWQRLNLLFMYLPLAISAVGRIIHRT